MCKTTALPVNQNGGELKGVRGQMLTYTADPFIATDESKCYQYLDDGLIVIQDGIMIDVGDYKDIAPKYPQLKNVDQYQDAVILPGFIDCHVHYVQSPMIGSFGDTLLSWLNQYTFPTESCPVIPFRKSYAYYNAPIPQRMRRPTRQKS